MGGLCRGFVLDAGIAQGREIYTFEKSLTGAEQNWRYGYVHLIDKPLVKVLVDDIDSATNADIFTSRSLPSALQRNGRPVRNKIKGRSAIHDKRRARMVSEYEYQHVIHRVLAPPTPPTLVWPWAANRPEHISAEDPCADVLKASGGIFIVDARFPAIATEQLLLKSSGRDRPTMKQSAANAQWIFYVLVWTRPPETRRRGILHRGCAQPTHRRSFRLGTSRTAQLRCR